VLAEAAGRVIVVRFSSGIGTAALVSSDRLTEAAGRVVVVREALVEAVVGEGVVEYFY
jgi:hypothetical protein